MASKAYTLVIGLKVEFKIVIKIVIESFTTVMLTKDSKAYVVARLRIAAARGIADFV